MSFKISSKAIIGIVFILLVGVAMVTVKTASVKPIEKKAKAIVVVSFGTTFADSRKACIESIENRIKNEFPEYDVYRAFTSKIVIKNIAEKENIHIKDLEETLTSLKEQGYKEVIVQTTHLTPGEEYDKKVLATISKFDKDFDVLVVGRPLLYFDGKDGKPNDFEILAEALRKQLPSDQAVFFMGHGSPHQANPVYAEMQRVFDAKDINAIVGVVEENDHPNFEDAKELLKERNIKSVIMMPLMVVAGDHANNDMAGDDKDSWKNKLIEKGYQVTTYMHGLGENTAVQDIYVQHVKDAIAGLK